ncbi:MAG: hypothetical protein HS122_07385 [Opitutaceae bacterium]|nr:hypothetical protein [Opitutaceae bacterium]
MNFIPDFPPPVRRSLLPLLLIAAASPPVAAQRTPDFEQPPISYSTSIAADAAAVLQDRINTGALRMEGDERRVLTELLAFLHVPVESQLLVFTKTSLQRGLIRPERPRAIYYSDSVYVGWVPGGLIEVAAIDPLLGPVFYAVDLRAGADRRSAVHRDPDCLRCHGGAFVRDIPAVFARSVFPDSTGEPMLQLGTLVVEDDTPFADRWGGWYVTGYSGGTHHRGNSIFVDDKGRPSTTGAEARPDKLDAYFDVERYLRPHSDVVSLLVFEHQTTMQNVLTRANQSTRKMMAYQRSLQESFKEPFTDVPTYDSVKRVFASATQEIVDRLLFHNAAPLPDGVDGGAAFKAAFTAAATRSRSGDSLRDFELKDRIFRLRCSYLIYSASFTALPAPLQSQVFHRLNEVLSGIDPDKRYDYIPHDEKSRIHQVLAETVPTYAGLLEKSGNMQP